MSEAPDPIGAWTALDKRIEELDLGPRTTDAFARAGVRWIWQLVELDLRAVATIMGSFRQARYLEELIDELGLRLGTKLPDDVKARMPKE